MYAAMLDAPHLLINGLSIGSGGGYTVACELLRGIAKMRPRWRVTMALIPGHSLHHEFEREVLPSNASLHWAPKTTRWLVARLHYERHGLIHWAMRNGVTGLIMLNGHAIPNCSIPQLVHNQDPWPYRPQAWTKRTDPLQAFVKRRGHVNGMRSAHVYGWTSHYLRELVCAWHREQPARDCVFYNGLPEEWIERARIGTSIPIERRPLQIVTVSNLTGYKRQELVVRAVARLQQEPEFKLLRYVVIGHGIRRELKRLHELAIKLGVQESVSIEGRVSSDRVNQAMAKSRAFVLMSLCESFGLPAIEAMTFGTPVVVSASCAHPEICADAAALVRADDLDHLVDTLKVVLQNPNEAAAMAERGRKRALDFRWSDTIRQMLMYLEPMMVIPQTSADTAIAHQSGEILNARHGR